MSVIESDTRLWHSQHVIVLITGIDAESLREEHFDVHHVVKIPFLDER